MSIVPTAINPRALVLISVAPQARAPKTHRMAHNMRGDDFDPRSILLPLSSVELSGLRDRRFGDSNYDILSEP